MPVLASVNSAFRNLFRKQRVEKDLDDEMRSHIELLTDEKMRQGMKAEDAARAARLELGGVEHIKEQVREARAGMWLETLCQDLRFGVRQLRKNPSFTAVAVLTLALGIGANTAIFSLIDAVMIKMLPVQQPRELVQVVHPEAEPQPHGFDVLSQALSDNAWVALRDRQDVFSGIFAWSERNFDLAQGGEARNANGVFVSGDYFSTLGVHPIMGRLLTTADDFRGCPGIAVLSYGFWQNRYGGDANVVSGLVRLDDHPFQIVGVSVPGFFGVDAASKFDVAVPLCSEAILDGSSSWLGHSDFYQLRVMGRLKPVLSAEQASAGLATLSPSIFSLSTAPQNWTGNALRDFLATRLRALPSAMGVSWVRDNYAQPLQALMAVAVVVLLIACANISCLLLARATFRKKELAIRAAMGASRIRIMRQLLTECALLSLAGAFVGLFFARISSAFFVRAISQPLFGGVGSVSVSLALDWRVLAFTAAVSVLVSILLGVFPSVLSARISVISAMKGPDAEEADHRSGFRPARWIVAAQVALSLVLLFAAGLFIKSFWKLANLDLGFDRKNVLLVNANIHNAHVPEAQRAAVWESILSQLRATPGATSVSQSWMTPINNWAMARSVLPRGPNSPTGPDALVFANFVSRGFCETLRIPLLFGRDFTASDAATNQSLAIINETMAHNFFPGEDPIGKYFASELPGQPRMESQVVGVVNDSKYLSLREDFHSTAYFPAAQMAPIPESWNFEIRTASEPSGMERSAEAAVLSVNKSISLDFSILAQQVDDSIKPERLLAVLSGFFGGLAVLLAMIGLYGVLSYSVAQRVREIGIRMALGAEKSNVLRMVIGQGFRLALTGVVIGVVAALILARLLSSFSNLLYGVRMSDLVTFATVSLVMIGVAILACYIPARRATRVDPVVALRHE